MLSRRQLNPTDSSVRPNSSCSRSARSAARQPRQQVRTAAGQRKPEAFDGLKGPAIVDLDRGERVVRQ